MKERFSHRAVDITVNKAIQKTGKVSAKDWTCKEARSTKVTGGHTLYSLYELVRNRTIRGKPFRGLGSWDNYLKKVHGVVPLDQIHWSNDRIHHTIAKLLKKHKPEKISWSREREPLPYGKSLSAFYQLAFKSNRWKAPKGREFFNHKTWSDYVAWLRSRGHLKQGKNSNSA